MNAIASSRLSSACHSNKAISSARLVQTTRFMSCGPRNAPTVTSPLSEEAKTEALKQLSKDSGWSVAPQRAYIAKALQFKSFTDSWAFMSALALYSARKNHHPNILQAYNRVYIQLNTHERTGSDKISRADINMARFIDKRISDAVLLDSTPIVAAASNSLEGLMQLAPSPSGLFSVESTESGDK